MGWKTALNCEVRLEKLKMEVVPSNHEVDAGEIFDQTEVLHSLLTPLALKCRPKEVTYRVFFLTGAPIKVLSVRLHSKSHQKNITIRIY